MDSTETPTLSIVIVSAFDTPRLNRTLGSILSSVENLEVILVTPESDEQTREMCLTFQDAVRYPVQIITDQNQGIYPAMNYGIQVASGKYLMFWNSGDFCAGESKLMDLVSTLKESDVLWGVVQGNFSWRPKIELNIENVKRFIFQNGGYVSHQCVFASKALITSLGSFDTNYKVAADTKLITQFWLKSPPIFIEIPVVDVESPGFSSKQHRTARIENVKISWELLPFPGVLVALASAIQREILYLIRKIHRKTNLFLNR